MAKSILRILSIAALLWLSLLLPAAFAQQGDLEAGLRALPPYDPNGPKYADTLPQDFGTSQAPPQKSTTSSNYAEQTNALYFSSKQSSCMQYEGGSKWIMKSDRADLSSCVIKLFDAKCVTPGYASYGMWDNYTIRHVPGLVEISNDNKTFSILVRENEGCSFFSPVFLMAEPSNREAPKPTNVAPAAKAPQPYFVDGYASSQPMKPKTPAVPQTSIAPKASTAAPPKKSTASSDYVEQSNALYFSNKTSGCQSQNAGGWFRTISYTATLSECVEEIFDAKCVTQGNASYGYWDGYYLRHVPGHVEISKDKSNYSILVREGQGCSFQSIPTTYKRGIETKNNLWLTAPLGNGQPLNPNTNKCLKYEEETSSADYEYRNGYGDLTRNGTEIYTIEYLKNICPHSVTFEIKYNYGNSYGVETGTFYYEVKKIEAGGMIYLKSYYNYELLEP